MKHTLVLSVVISSILSLFAFTANALTFTLSDDAIMALDYDYYNCGDPCAIITKITDVPGRGVRFDILVDNPFGDPYLQRISGIEGGKGILTGIDISRFDAFALKFTLLSARGIGSPGKIGSLCVGAMINSPGSEYGYSPEEISLNYSDYPPTATSITTTEGAGQIGLVGFTFYIFSYLYDDNYPNPWDPKGVKISLLVEPADDAIIIFAKPIDKCTVASGKTKESSSIFVSGKINATADDLLNDYDDTIEVSIDSNDMSDPCVIAFPIDNKGFLNNGKFTYSVTENGVKKSFKLDLKTHKFSFSAKNIDLSGLSCPLNMKIDINDYNTETVLDETIVNGKKPIPINLLMGVKNSLRVDKIKVKYGSKMNSDLLTVSGGFSAQDVDVNMAAEDFSVTLGSQIFTIPAKSFNPNKTKTKFTCSNVKLNGGIGIAAAAFDFNRCTFAITIKKASIDYLGDTAQFAVQCAGFNAHTEVEISY
jgi:hypothetical protein